MRTHTYEVEQSHSNSFKRNLSNLSPSPDLPSPTMLRSRSPNFLNVSLHRHATVRGSFSTFGTYRHTHASFQLLVHTDIHTQLLYIQTYTRKQYVCSYYSICMHVWNVYVVHLKTLQAALISSERGSSTIAGRALGGMPHLEASKRLISSCNATAIRWSSELLFARASYLFSFCCCKTPKVHTNTQSGHMERN